MSAWDIYEHELYRLSHGLPIWQAEPFSIEQEIHIGDVGYMNEGKFIRVFNVFYGDTSSDVNVQQQPEGLSGNFFPRIFPGPFPNDEGVPPGHVLLTMRANNIQRHAILPIKPYSTEKYSVTEVSPHAGVDPSTPIAGSGTQFKFWTKRRRVAALFLQAPGEIKRPRGEEPFAIYSQDRWRSWREFTRNTIHGFRAAENLMFVYGHTKTKAWTSTAFEQSRTAGSISFNVTIPAIGSGGLAFSHDNSTYISPHVNFGPQSPYIDDDHDHDHDDGNDGDGSPARNNGDIQIITQDESTSHVWSSNRTPVKRNQTVFCLRLKESDRPRVIRLIEILASLKQLLGRSAPSTSSGAVDTTKSRGTEGEASSSNTTLSQRSVPRTTRVSPTIASLATTDIDLLLSRVNDTFDDVMSGFHIDPLDYLLIYVLEIEDSAHRAVVSDDDMNGLFLAYISRHGELTDNIAQVLHELKPNTYTDATGVGHVEFDHPNSMHGPKTTAITPAETLPKAKNIEVDRFIDDSRVKSLFRNGFISHTFGSSAAETLLSPFLRRKAKDNVAPTYIAATRDPYWTYSSPDTILDFEVPKTVRDSVIRQRLGGDPGENSMYPIFFYSKDALGIHLQTVLARKLGGLLRRDKHVLFGGRDTINLCIHLHGYADFSQQIHTTEMPQRSAMTHEKLLSAVARTVSWFLQHPPEQTSESGSSGRRSIGRQRITEFVSIIGLVQVSEDTWQPILRDLRP